jgi:hypothetical protein
MPTAIKLDHRKPITYEAALKKDARDVMKVYIAFHCVAVPAEHRVDGFRELGVVALVDATGVGPEEAVQLASCAGEWVQPQVLRHLNVGSDADMQLFLRQSFATPPS